MKLYRPEKIYIERAAKDSANFSNINRILSRLPGVPIEIVDDTRSLIESARRPSAGSGSQAKSRDASSPLSNRLDPIGAGKKCLLLALDQGRSFKPFPESADYLSCDYYTLHVAEGCDLECSYCILQAYLTNPLLTVYVNIGEMLEKLQRVLDQNPEKFFRIGTGQLADSLSLDPITGYSEILVPFFAQQKNAVLELKTKSTNIENLLKLDPQGKTIVSWSMNSKRIQREEEHKCASIEERLQAAVTLVSFPRRSDSSSPHGLRRGSKNMDSRLKACGNDEYYYGYRLGFHFDPIIDYPGWEEEYGEVINEIFDQIPHDRIAWISLGCLRFMPELKSIMQSRFPKSTLASAEWIKGMDGKLRYLKPRRIEIYREMAARIRGLAPGAAIYLSMESPEVWREVFGGDYSKASVCSLLDRAGKGMKAGKMASITT